MNIVVYCGSSAGAKPEYKDAARDLGEWMAAKGHTLVFGGGSLGLMGIVSDAVISGGGQAIGIIPQFLKVAEPPHEGLTRLEVVETMAERKTRMIELGDAFVALPGGPGTLEEISEVISLIKIARFTGETPGPCVLVNVAGFYSPLIEQLDYMEQEGFMFEGNRDAIGVANSISELEALLER